MDLKNEAKWQLVSIEGTIVEFKSSFSTMAKLLEEQNIEEEVRVGINENTLKFIQKFCELHNYDISQIEVKQPIKSNIFQENVDGKTFNLLKDYSGIKNAQNLTPLIEASYFLLFEKFQDCCLAALACDFYIGNTEEDLVRFEQYRKQNNISDLTPEEELDIMLEYEGVFKKVNEEIKRQYTEDLEKLEQNDQQLNQQQI